MTPTNVIDISGVPVGGTERFALITGPCQLESLEHARMMAGRIAEACAPSGTRFIFKGSYDKANRSSIGTALGLGMETGLTILARIREEFGCPVVREAGYGWFCENLRVEKVMKAPRVCRPWRNPVVT